MIVYVIVATIVVALVGLAISVRILKQYERAVMFGRSGTGLAGQG